MPVLDPHGGLIATLADSAFAVERARFGRSGLYDVTVTRADGTLVAEFRGRSRSLGRLLLG